MTSNDEELAAIYGPAAPFSEHQRGERVRYQINGFNYTGEIIWVAAAGNVKGKHLPLHYIVTPDPPNGLVDVILPSDVQA